MKFYYNIKKINFLKIKINKKMKKLLSITLILFIFSNIVISFKIDNPTKTDKKENLRKNQFEGVEKIHALKPLKRMRATKPRIPVVSTINQEVDKNTTIFIDKAPFKITRCDQLVGFMADFIPDDNDYTIRKQAFFTMSAYHFGKFTKKDINTLEVAFEWSNSQRDAFMPIGAENCLSIDGGVNVKPILLCAKNREEYNQYLDFIDNFQDCRSGKAWGTPSQEPVKSNLGDSTKAACAAAGFTGNPDDIIAAMEAKEKADKERSNPSGISGGWWIPGGFKVPGTPVPTLNGK